MDGKRLLMDRILKGRYTDFKSVNAVCDYDTQ